MIQEHQQRVMDRIRKQAQLQADESRSAENNVSSDIDSELEYYQLQQQLELDRIALERDRSGSAFTSNETPAVLEESSHVKRGSSDSFHRIPSPIGEAREENARIVKKSQDTTSDSTTTLSNGKKLKLKGTKHTLKAISKGTAILVSCAGCQTLLQVPSTCTAVYCYVCDAVTPIDLARSISDSHSEQHDSEIAIALQQQELDLALSRDRN